MGSNNSPADKMAKNLEKVAFDTAMQALTAKMVADNEPAALLDSLREGRNIFAQDLKFLQISLCQLRVFEFACASRC